MQLQVLMLCFLSALAFAEVWEFGDPKGGQLTYSTNGYIGMFEKNIVIHIPLEVASTSRKECRRKVTYVRVDVNNLLSTPEVTFDKLLNHVYIRYGFWQSSISWYNIKVKTKCPCSCCRDVDDSELYEEKVQTARFGLDYFDYE